MAIKLPKKASTGDNFKLYIEHLSAGENVFLSKFREFEQPACKQKLFNDMATDAFSKLQQQNWTLRLASI